MIYFEFSVFGIAVTCSLWWLYFDDIIDQTIKRVKGASYVWVFSHLPLAIGLTAFGVGAKKVFIQPTFEPLADKYRWLSCIAMILYLVFVAIIDLVTERKDQATLDNSRRVLWRFGAAALVLLIAIFGGFLTPIFFIALMAVIILSQFRLNAFPLIFIMV